MMKRPWLSFRYVAENYRNYSTTPNVTSKQKLKILKDAYLCEGKYRSSVDMAQDLAQNIVYYDKKNDTSGTNIKKPLVLWSSVEKPLHFDGFFYLNLYVN